MGSAPYKADNDAMSKATRWRDKPERKRLLAKDEALKNSKNEVRNIIHSEAYKR